MLNFVITFPKLAPAIPAGCKADYQSCFLTNRYSISERHRTSYFPDYPLFQADFCPTKYLYLVSLAR